MRYLQKLRCQLLTPAITILLMTVTTNASTLRVVTYNVNFDTTDFTGPGGTRTSQLANIETVLEGIGNEHLNDNGAANAQPFDVLALQELAPAVGGTASTTLATFVAQLNAHYGAGTYAYVPVYDPVDGGTTGNGPSGLIYNTKTVSVVSATILGSVSGSGAPRAPVQYLLQPVGYSSAADFYVDVSHTKSGTDSDSAGRRNIEANTLVSNVENTLAANAHVIALGDFNITAGSSEATYKTMRTAFDDPGNSAGNWSDVNTSTRKQFAPLLSENSSDVLYRDDIQFVSPAADAGSGSAGLEYDLGSSTVFGNGGSTLLVGNAVSTPGDNPGVFPDLSPAYVSTLLTALADASDHLPVVADYSIVGYPSPEPGSLAILSIGLGLLFRGRRR